MVKLKIEYSSYRIIHRDEIKEVLNSVPHYHYYDHILNKTIYVFDEIDAVAILLRCKWFSIHLS
jgi:hypothetical protein